jgi:hypothetical protein
MQKELKFIFFTINTACVSCLSHHWLRLLRYNSS